MKNARRLDRLTTRKTARQGVFRRLLRVVEAIHEAGRTGRSVAVPLSESSK